MELSLIIRSRATVNQQHSTVKHQISVKQAAKSLFRAQIQVCQTSAVRNIFRRDQGLNSKPAWGYDRPMAKLYFHYSTMNAGKSTLLLQASHNYRERGMQTYLMTARLDNRAGQGRIASRIGIGDEADLFQADEDLFAKISQRLTQGDVACIFIDEAQFLQKEQVWQLARAVDDLKVPIMCYGLRVDFQGELFPGSAALLALADEMREARTICHCGKKATMVVRMGSDGKIMTDGDQVQIGGNETYLSLCRRHWREATGDASPENADKS